MDIKIVLIVYVLIWVVLIASALRYHQIKCNVAYDEGYHDAMECVNDAMDEMKKRYIFELEDDEDGESEGAQGGK